MLHVFSRTLSVGGHTRMVWRWMGLDDGRSHSVAVTRQGRRDVPPELVAMAEDTGGSVTVLDRAHGDVLARARALHELATHADVVILHIDPEDIVPVVAFGDRSGLPPILYLNHADHLFWLGVGIADLVVNLRRSGHGCRPNGAVSPRIATPSCRSPWASARVDSAATRPSDSSGSPRRRCSSPRWRER